MVADPEKGLVTDLMLGMMLVFGFDVVLLLGVFWIAGLVSGTAFFTVTTIIVACYGVWIGYRWWGLRSAESTEPEPLDELKRRYAAGELTEDEFEAKLETVMEEPNTGDSTGRGEKTANRQQQEPAVESEQ